MIRRTTTALAVTLVLLLSACDWVPYLHHPDGRPWTWRPCTYLNYSIQGNDAFHLYVHAAINQVQAFTGREFRQIDYNNEIQDLQFRQDSGENLIRETSNTYYVRAHAIIPWSIGALTPIAVKRDLAFMLGLGVSPWQPSITNGSSIDYAAGDIRGLDAVMLPCS